ESHPGRDHAPSWPVDHGKARIPRQLESTSLGDREPQELASHPGRSLSVSTAPHTATASPYCGYLPTRYRLVFQNTFRVHACQPSEYLPLRRPEADWSGKRIPLRRLAYDGFQHSYERRGCPTGEISGKTGC